LNEQNVERFAILKRSLERFLGNLRTCWVATPDSQFASIARRFASNRFEFLKESDVLPDLNTWISASPSCRVQAVMLALAMRRVEGNFVLFLTPDTICTRPVAMNDMLVDGRSRWSRSIDQAHAQFYQTAEHLLGLERSGFVYSRPPGVLSRAVLADLTAHLESRSHGDVRPSGSRWPSLLLGTASWTLISLYFTFLDGLDLVHVHHSPTGLPFVGHPVGSEKVWEQWDLAAAFAPDAPYAFTVVRTGPGIPPEAVWDRVGPYISAPSELPTSFPNVNCALQKGETRRPVPSVFSTSMRP
jgi:hypothetical protein